MKNTTTTTTTTTFTTTNNNNNNNSNNNKLTIQHFSVVPTMARGFVMHLKPTGRYNPSRWPFGTKRKAKIKGMRSLLVIRAAIYYSVVQRANGDLPTTARATAGRLALKRKAKSEK